MKQKRDYVNIMVLLMLSLVMQNSAASDAYWWSRWAPSKETLAGIACAAPLAIYAQRYLAQRAQTAQLPTYSYFIPGMIGALAAALWAQEKWSQSSVQNNQQHKQDDSVQSMIRNYELQSSRLIYDFENVLKKSNISEKKTLISQELFTQVNDQYNTVVGIYNDLVGSKLKYPNNERLNQLAMLTPAEVLYAHYLSYIYSLKQPSEKSFAQLTPEEKKELVMYLSGSYALTFIKQLKEAKFEIPDATQDFLPHFDDLLAGRKSDDAQYKKAEFLMRDIWMVIKEYEQAHDKQQLEDKITSPVRLIGTSHEKEYAIENEKVRLQGLMNEYQQKINEFIEQLFSEKQDRLVNLKYNDLLSLYASLQESITWLRRQGVSGLPENNLLLLEPHDYIYAVIYARVIKPMVSGIDSLKENDPESMKLINNTTQNQQIKSIVNKIISKSPTLQQDIMAANDKKNNDRNTRLTNKIIQLIKKEKKLEEDLLESTLHEVIDQ